MAEPADSNFRFDDPYRKRALSDNDVEEDRKGKCPAVPRHGVHVGCESLCQPTAVLTLEILTLLSHKTAMKLITLFPITKMLLPGFA
jgi:hypothetical protein